MFALTPGQLAPLSPGEQVDGNTRLLREYPISEKPVQIRPNGRDALKVAMSLSAPAKKPDPLVRK
jgi:hypothetical protein